MVMTSDLPALPPLTAAEYLDWMRPDLELPQLYVLGSINRHITVHSQQCRAINLIQALMRDGAGDGLDNKSVAIVGAGFAGLTAAAFATERTTAEVTLFEAAPRPLWLQDDCAGRWLHPGIYDWPYAGSLEPHTALPVLNWRAGSAKAVAAQVRAEWERTAATKAKLRLRFEQRVTGAAAADGKLVLKVAGGRDEAFDVVILAVGFGLEPGVKGRVGYWNDADGLDGIAPDASVLISGFGDGGLADVLRLCLPQRRQDSLVELVRHVPAEYRNQLIDWDARYYNDPAKLDELYSGLRVEPVIDALKRYRRQPGVRVTLAGGGHLYGPRSAILNRFLVSQLNKARADGAFTLVNRPVLESSLQALPDGGYSIRFIDDSSAHKFDHVVLRLGPQPAYPAIEPPRDWKVMEERRRHWFTTPQSNDRTRVPLDATAAGPIVTTDFGRDCLVNESSARPWCLVLHPPQPKLEWSTYARRALQDADKALKLAKSAARGGGAISKDQENSAKDAAAPDELNDRPLILDSEAAVTSFATLATAVRALCAADIAIVDVTDDDPSLFLLLGIRAAVRRGVTIACTQRPLTSELLERLPFNLKELNLISLADATRNFAELVEALRAGLTESGATPRYLDLPVYDYVRGDQRPTADAASNVLMLRAFSNYSPARELHVRKAVAEACGVAEKRVQTVVDQTSPRLAGQRLYGAIRHWQSCVVDLTWWRPNVLFELGVRLAVRPGQTVCLIDVNPERDRTFAGSRAQLKKLLQPYEYNLDADAFHDAFAAPVSSEIYQAAARHFRTAQDHPADDVDIPLLAAAGIDLGRDDPLQEVDVTQLYARDRPNYAETLRRSSLEQLCAAWFYLADRKAPHRARPIDLLDPLQRRGFSRFRQLGGFIRQKLVNRVESRDVLMRERIEQCEETARQSGAVALAALLADWSTLRDNPPWEIPLDDVESEEWDDLIEDYTLQRRQLQKLHDMLVGLANPVCRLPLQGIELDLQRTDVMLRRFARRKP